MDDVEIRPCDRADLEVLTSRWPASGVHEAHHRRQAEGLATYLVAWRADEPLGSAMVQWSGCVGPAARRAFPDAVEINHLQVRAHAQGRGIGSRLIERAEALAAARGRTEVAVGVSSDNPRAERLYLRLRYVPTGVVDTSEYDWTDEDGAVRHAVEEDQLLVKELSRPVP